MNQKTKQIIKEYVESILVAFILAMFIRTYVVQAFKIPTGSMIPTLNIGDRLLVNKFIYRFHKPERGDVIIFPGPPDPAKEFIKRLIAFPGEMVEIRDGDIYINGKLIEDEKIKNWYYYNVTGEPIPEMKLHVPYGIPNQKFRVPDGSYLALGDNSGNSLDGRAWGFVPVESVKGKALVVYWPLSEMRIIR